MNDQPTSDALSRASAYLDGELDAVEIAAAEADPAVMTEVAQLRSLQEAIREVGEPTSSARDTAIAAALAEYDRTRHPAPVVRSRPRPAYTRWLAVAAAVAGLAALGAVIATNTRGDSDNAGTASEATAADEFAAGSDATLLSRAASAGGAPSAPAPESAQSQAALATEQTGAPAATTNSAEADAVLAAPATIAAASAAGAPPFDPGSPIPNEVELGRIGRQLLAELVAGSRPSMTGTACDGKIPGVVVLSDAMLDVDGVARPVLVAANRNNGDTFALDPDTCVVVATGQ